MMKDTDSNQQQWYAAKVHYNRTERVRLLLDNEPCSYYVPPKEIPSLVFIRCTEQHIRHLGSTLYEYLWVYRQPGSNNPAPIPDHELEVFRMVVEAPQQGLTYLGDDLPKYHLGDRVRVKAGIFKGLEGHVVRIKKDRRLVVSIKGIVAVATTHITPDLLEVINQ